MSSVLYYSNYCNHCKELLKTVAQSSVKEDIHFLCIAYLIHDGVKSKLHQVPS